MELWLSKIRRFTSNGAKLSFDLIWKRAKNFTTKRVLWGCEGASTGLFCNKLLGMTLMGLSVNGCTYPRRIECINKRPNFKSIKLSPSSELVP